MSVGKKVDELTDGVVGRHLRQQFLLVYPSKGQLVTGHLHPYGVYTIRWYRHDVGHYNPFALTQGDRILLVLLPYGLNLNGYHLRHSHCFRLLRHNHQRVTRHNEVIVLRIVMGRIERDGVELLLGEIPGIWRYRALIVTRYTK